LATFRNVIAPTKARNIPFDGDMLWQLISHLSLNYLSITDHTTLQAILRQYIAPDNRDKSGRLVNEKKIAAISNVTVKAGESLLDKAFVHGQNIKVTIKSENFECMGDKYLFGSVLDRFFAGTAAINVYSELTFEDFFSGECQQWPAKIGNRPLQ
jgi:type VI secretion system protein ImpG